VGDMPVSEPPLLSFVSLTLRRTDPLQFVPTLIRIYSSRQREQGPSPSEILRARMRRGLERDGRPSKSSVNAGFCPLALLAS
jgi:hypothetical protein